MAYSDLGQRVKQKYPGVYDDLDDDQLGQAVASKHPGAYDDIIGTVTDGASTGRSGLEKVAAFAGVENLGKGLGQALGTDVAVGRNKENANLNQGTVQKLIQRIRAEKDVTKKQKLKEILGRFQSQTSEAPTIEDQATNGQGFVSNRSVASDALRVATTLGTLGAPTGAATAGKLAPIASTTVKGRIGLGAISGTGYGAAEAVESATSATDAVKKIATGAATGAVTSGAVEGIVGGTKKLLGRAAEEIYNRIIKTPVKQTVAGKTQIGTGSLERGVKGDLDSMIGQFKEIAESNKAQLDDVLKRNASVKIDLAPVKAALTDLRKQLIGTPGETTTAVDKVIKGLGKQKTINLRTAQLLKTNLQKAVNEAFLRQNTSGVTQAQKVAAQQLRSAIEQAVPDVVPLNRELEFSIRGMNQLIRQAGQSPSKLRLFAELGLGTYGLLGANPVVLGGLATERLLTAPRTATNIAQTLYKGSKKALPPELAQLLQRLGIGRLND